jgi:lipoate-protein ligase B
MDPINEENRRYFAERSLLVYFLPRLPWEQVQKLQQRLVFDVSEPPRRQAALILCEHAPIITVGRQGSYRHLRMDAREIDSGQLSVKWTNRGGGCWHQQPGQLAAYPILPLDSKSFGLGEYRTGVYQTLLEVLREFQIDAQADRASAGVRTEAGQIASVGLAVKQWVSYHGCILNVCVPLDRRPLVLAGPMNATQPGSSRPWTCMFRELRTPVNVSAVRESFLRHFVNVFGFDQYYLSNPPPGIWSDKRREHADAKPTYR